MAIAHEVEQHRFAAYDETGQYMGEITYAPRGEKTIAATHTRVDTEHRGKGVAGELLSALAAWAEAEAMTIVPVCSYVAAAFERDPERYGKVMHAEQ